MTRDEIREPQDLAILVEQNGKDAMGAHTGDMINGLRDLIRFLSAATTLQPGDLITTGTPAGVSKLAPGDHLKGTDRRHRHHGAPRQSRRIAHRRGTLLMPAAPKANPPVRACSARGRSVHPRVLQALSLPVIGHLDPKFLEIMDQSMAMLREVFQTKNRLALPMSGTGSAGMETCSPISSSPATPC